jgi:hypothetical protein
MWRGLSHSRSIFVNRSIVPLIGIVVGVQLIAVIVHAVIVGIIVWIHAIASVVIRCSTHGDVSSCAGKLGEMPAGPGTPPTAFAMKGIKSGDVSVAVLFCEKDASRILVSVVFQIAASREVAQGKSCLLLKAAKAFDTHAFQFHCVSLDFILNAGVPSRKQPRSENAKQAAVTEGIPPMSASIFSKADAPVPDANSFPICCRVAPHRGLPPQT